LKKILGITLSIFLFASSISLYAVGSHDAQYVGGTVEAIPKSQTGELIAADANLNFQYKKASFAIPYSSITDMEYGDKPSTRIGTSIGVALICWPCGIATLFVKAKHHFLTLEFTDSNNKKQAAVFELGKALPDALLPTLEVKTDKKVVHQDQK
jgi:hypothetical protein